MADPSDRTCVVLRHREAVLTCAATAAGRRLPTAAVDDDPEPALEALLDRLGAGDRSIERRADPVEAGQARLHPVLVGVGDRPPVGEEACPDPTWVAPSTLLRGADDRWWRAYAAVAPTVETVAGDTERGSSAVAVDALWVLRDAAALAAVSGDGIDPVRTTAQSLLRARPSMAALGNRVDRAMAGAGSPADVEAAATAGLVRAFEADGAAAALAADAVSGGRVLTLSRSGTVRDALVGAASAVVVLASRPGGEGLGVAADLRAAGLSASAVPDGSVYDVVRSGDVDAVLVGADAVTADGGVVNKVGTRAAALAADAADVPFFVVCASDKVRPAAEAVTESPPIDPMFDWTPPGVVTAVFTERGRLTPDGVLAIAEEHRELARWRSGPVEKP